MTQNAILRERVNIVQVAYSALRNAPVRVDVGSLRSVGFTNGRLSTSPK
jgi:hypothetical protein